MKFGGRTIGVLVEQSYQEIELWYPVLRFREEGARVMLIGPEKGKTYPSKLGYPAVADTTPDEIDLDEIDALIIPGGFAPDFMRRHPSMVALVRDLHARGAVIAAVCHGPWMLISAGILQDRKATSFSSLRDDMVNAGADYVDEEAVRDGNIVTSRGPADLPGFCRAISDTLEAASAPSAETQPVTA